MKKQRTKRSNKPKSLLLMPGLDYGLDNSLAIITAPQFNDNLRAANIIACAYGLKHSAEIRSEVPIISLVATKPEPLKDALIQFKAWIDATGPDALRVEILYSDQGYHISFGPSAKHLLWRTVGLDRTVDPLILGLTYIKTIDTRNPFLDQLAEQLPVAPVIVSGAHYTGPEQPSATPNSHHLRPIPSCPELLLFQLPIYKTPSEVPRESGLASFIGTVSKEELASSRGSYQRQASSPDRVFSRREQRISSLMPVTIHMLRTFKPLRGRLQGLASSGFAPWQLEQAVVNQRLWAQLSPEAKRLIQKPKELPAIVSRFMELDRPNWQDVAGDEAAILKQAERDLRVLLKGLGMPRSDNQKASLRQLAEQGYISSENPP
jgi:hypothetical protein